MNKHELWELQSMQAAPLSVKISMTKQRIREWVNTYGEDGVYVSFSGGKDSTVLLNLVREDFPNVPAVFCDIPTQYPELREFAETYDNVEIVKPKMNFFQVCEKYGFPLISKEVSETVQGARKYLTRILNENRLDRPTDRPTGRFAYRYKRLCGLGEFNRTGKTNFRSVNLRTKQKSRNSSGCLRSRLGEEQKGEYP